ncbi:hypothetical protein HZS_710 [Henneguya salminicola]|nr:hypothetical protein HZS_710 [Henneguya salminicola]
MKLDLICCAISRSGILLYESRFSEYNSASYSYFFTSLMERLRSTRRKNAILIMNNWKFHKTVETQTTITNAQFD